jgi:hypothetical protein
VDTYGDILADARESRESAVDLLTRAQAGRYLPTGVTISGLEQSIRDYDVIIKRLGWRDNA